MKHFLFPVLIAVVLGLIACTSGPTAATFTPSTVATTTVTTAPTVVATAPPTSTPTPTNTPTATPQPQALVKETTAIYTGPGNLGYDTVTQLANGTMVTPLGVYGDFVQVQAPVSGTVQSGFVLAQSLGALHPNLPKLSQNQVPWLIKSFTASGPLTYSNSGSAWDG